MTKKKIAKKKKGKSKAGFYGAAIAILVILAAIYVGQTLDNKNDTATGAVTANEETLVTVNGVDITSTELDLRYRNLPPNLQAFVTKESLLDELITEKVLTQKADDLGIEVTEADVQEQIDLIKAQQGLTEEQIDEILVSQGQSLAQFREELYTQLRFQKLFEQELETTEPTEQEISDAYETLQPGVVRHILLVQEENESDEDFEARTQEVFDMIENDYSNFCDLVNEYTQDPGSKETCGEYEVFAGSNFVPEFEEAGLRLMPGEVEIVDTQFGKHIIYKVNNIPLEDVREEIISTLKLGQSQGLVDTYIALLRAEANIVYPGEEEMQEVEGDAMESDTEMEEQVMVSEENSDVEEPVMIDIDELMEEETIEEPQEVMEEVMEEVTIIPEVTYEDVQECLEDVKLYGAFWDSQTKKQLNVFDETPDFYIECFEGSYDNKKAECADIQGYPTWQIGDKEYLGFMSLNTLKNLAGCEE